MATCSKCGPDVPQALFNKSGTICDPCWESHDMDRFKGARPAKASIPDAIVVELSDGKLGIRCPHCDYNVHRANSYFTMKPSTQRCPKCMEHYCVKKGKAI